MKEHTDILAAIDGRRGHFLLESGYHTDLWLTLDALFVEPQTVRPMVDALAERLRDFRLSGVCGPLLGGAFLAQALATAMGLRFYCAAPQPAASREGLFGAAYRLPEAQRKLVEGERLAVVDEVISAGSSVRATIAALEAARAKPVVVATCRTLGEVGRVHFAERGIPLVALDHRDFALWKPTECPLCRAGQPLETPP